MLHQSKPVCTLPVEGTHLCGLTWWDGLLWYSDADLAQVFAVNPRTAAIVRSIACPDVRTDLTVVDDHLLQVAGEARQLRVMDPATGATVEELPNPRPGDILCGLESARGGIWLGYKQPQLLELRSWPDLRLIEAIDVSYDVAGVTTVGGFVVFADHPNSRIHFLDRTARQVVATLAVSGNPTGLTPDGLHLWYCDYATSHLRAVSLPQVIAESLTGRHAQRSGTPAQP